MDPTFQPETDFSPGDPTPMQAQLAIAAGFALLLALPLLVRF